MDESRSPVKSGKQSQPRGAKVLSSEKSNKDAPAQRDGTKSAPRRQEHLAAAKDEHNIGSRGPGKTFTDIPQDKRRGRPSRLTRLTGRTSSGERGKGKAVSSQQQLVAQAPDYRASFSADSSPSANRGTSSPAVPGTPERGLTEQAKSSTVTPTKEKSHGEFVRYFPWDDLLHQKYLWLTAQSLLFCRGESCCTDASVCSRGQRGEAHCGGRTADRATAGPPASRGAPLQRLHPPAVESKETIQSCRTCSKCKAELITAAALWVQPEYVCNRWIVWWDDIRSMHCYLYVLKESLNFYRVNSVED